MQNLKRISTAHLDRETTARNYRHLETYGRLCLYCGRTGDGVDHMPSIGQYHQSRLLLPAGEQEPPALAIRCCWTCNRMLGLAKFKNWPHERCQELYGRYAYKANVPIWEEDEVNELGYTLRTKIEAGQNKLVRTAGLLPYLWSRQRMLLLWKTSGGTVERLATLLLQPLSVQVPQQRKKVASGRREKA